MPKSFTYGEASIVIQGFVIFLTNLFFKLLAILQKTANCLDSPDSMSCELYSYKASSWTSNGNSEMEQLSTILQVIFQISSDVRSNLESFSLWNFRLDFWALQLSSLLVIFLNIFGVGHFIF